MPEPRESRAARMKAPPEGVASVIYAVDPDSNEINLFLAKRGKSKTGIWDGKYQLGAAGKKWLANYTKLMEASKNPKVSMLGERLAELSKSSPPLVVYSKFKGFVVGRGITRNLLKVTDFLRINHDWAANVLHKTRLKMRKFALVPETHEQTLWREMLEELKLDPDQRKVLDVRPLGQTGPLTSDPKTREYLIAHFYGVRVTPETLDSLVADEAKHIAEGRAELVDRQKVSLMVVRRLHRNSPQDFQPHYRAWFHPIDQALSRLYPPKS